MKNQLFLFALLLCYVVNGQLAVDDFTTGTLKSTLITTSDLKVFQQQGKTILGRERRIKIHLDKNPLKQSFQITIGAGVLAVTAPYDTKGTFSLLYGKIAKGESKSLQLDVSKLSNLHIRFAAKSTVNGFYAMLFSGNTRAVYGKQLPSKEGAFVFTIPLSDFKKMGESFKLSQIDGIRFQFDSRSKTGCSMAIEKIWFE